MSRRDDRVALQHMLDHSREAAELTTGKTRRDLEDERLLQLALVRLVEIVSMRNRLIHGFDFVDHDILWQTIQEDLPPLIETLESVLREEPA